MVETKPLGPLPEAPVRPGAVESFSVVALLDVDDFVASRLGRGPEWAAAEIATIEQLAEAERSDEPSVSSLYRLDPDEWIFVLSGSDPAQLEDAARELAERLRTRVAAATECTATV